MGQTEPVTNVPKEMDVPNTMNKTFPVRSDLLPRQEAGGVRFTFEAPPETTAVCVAGTFNSWVGDSCPLVRVSAATWQTVIPIATGRHLYKYVIDGRDWIIDPANPWISEDAQNNSCFTVNEFGEVLIRLGEISAENPNDLYRRHTALKTPDWLKQGVIYQLAVSSFGGSFAGVQARLPYLRDLGVTVIWMMPIHPIGFVGRLGQLGDLYAVRDFMAIDPLLGKEADLRSFIDAVHAAGMSIIMDWTLNRSSCDNPLTEQHPDWFTHNHQGEIYYAVPNRAYFAGFDFSNADLRTYLLNAMGYWVQNFDIDGFRFDDSDLTPLDFLEEVRASLAALRPSIGLISQSYDEFHHLKACDLTYEGGLREMILKVAAGLASIEDFERSWAAATYSFPRGALRMRWLEEKEQGRAFRYYGRELHLAAATIILTFDGVPHLLMGQEFNETGWQNWMSLFDDLKLNWTDFDEETFAHYRALIKLRRQHAALQSGQVEFIATGIAGLLGYWRKSAAEQVLVLVNLSSEPVTLPENSEVLTPVYTKGFSMLNRGVPTLEAFGCLIQRVVTEQKR